MIDDADQLGIKPCTYLLREICTLGDRYHCKLYLSLRTTTFNTARSTVLVGTLQHRDIRINPPSIVSFASEKLELIKKPLASQRVSLTTRGGARITYANAQLVFTQMIDELRSTECATLVAALAAQDLKRWKVLVKEYFRTGFLEYSDFAWRLLDAAVRPRTRKTKSRVDQFMWVPLSALLTSNHKTYFSRNAGGSLEFVVNLFCNGGHSKHANVIRFQLLSYIARRGGCRRDRLYADYLAICPPANPTIELETIRGVEHSLLRLLNCRLISSPDHLILQEESEVADVAELDVTSTGKYYLHDLSKYFEYVSFMKDSVDFEGEPNFRSCIDSRRFSDRYKDVLRFLEYLVGHERTFLENVPLVHRSDYLRKFSYDEVTVFFMRRIVASVAEYVKRRAYRYSYYRVFERAIATLLANMDGFSQKWRGAQ